MTAILARPELSTSAPQSRCIRLLLCWPIAREGLAAAARFAGQASIAAARVQCSVEDDQLALWLAYWTEDAAASEARHAPPHAIPLIRCREPDVRVVVDNVENVCHVDVTGVVAITFKLKPASTPNPEADGLLYATTTVALRLGLPPATLEKAVRTCLHATEHQSQSEPQAPC